MCVYSRYSNLEFDRLADQDMLSCQEHVSPNVNVQRNSDFLSNKHIYSTCKELNIQPAVSHTLT